MPIKPIQWWVSSSGRIQLCMAYDQATGASHPGPCDADVQALSEAPEIKAQLDAIDPAALREELKEFGAWEDHELEDHAENLQRVLWIAAGDIAENPEEE